MYVSRDALSFCVIKLSFIKRAWLKKIIYQLLNKKKLFNKR